MERLVAGAAELGIKLDASQLAAFRSYFEFLEERGRFVNLTAVRGWDAVRDDLFLRSLRILAVRYGAVEGAIAIKGAGIRVLDVGTGAGVPGMILKLALPLLDMTLLEATGKKADFVSECIERLGIKGARVVKSRAEEAARDPEFREHFDVVVARAVAQLTELAELTLPFARVGGMCVAQKGMGIEAELESSEYAVHELGGRRVAAQVVERPGHSSSDTLVVWTKERPTPEHYPRRPGIPHQRPLLAPGSRRQLDGERPG
ncbi:MAG: 16S rRNA (guanine(527)-N(7))-methyltransferase RsmG [Chloroflexi bacterium]|nr:16S rRNA (guanine(527)-N(7))-methyltransferase RsmG [Chloroflexota bacterium]